MRTLFMCPAVVGVQGWRPRSGCRTFVPAEVSECVEALRRLGLGPPR